MLAIASETGKTIDIGWVDYLQMGQVVTIAPTDRLQCVQCTPHRRTPQRMEVALKAQPIEGGDNLDQRLGVDEVDSKVVGGVAVAVEIGLDHRGGVVLDDPVEHQLDRGRPVAGSHPCSSANKSFDLLQPLIAFPPQSPDHRPDQLHRSRPGRDRPARARAEHRRPAIR